METASFPGWFPALWILGAHCIWYAKTDAAA